jgi:hypothetical protein
MATSPAGDWDVADVESEGDPHTELEARSPLTNPLIEYVSGGTFPPYIIVASFGTTVNCARATISVPQTKLKL